MNIKLQNASHHVLSDTSMCMLNAYVRNSRRSVVLNVHIKLHKIFIEFTGAGTTFRQSDRHSDICAVQRTTFWILQIQHAILPMADHVSQSLVTVTLTVQGNRIRDRSLQQTFNNVLDRADYCEGLAKRLESGRGWFDSEYSWDTRLRATIA